MRNLETLFWSLLVVAFVSLGTVGFLYRPTEMLVVIIVFGVLLGAAIGWALYEALWGQPWSERVQSRKS